MNDTRRALHDVLAAAGVIEANSEPTEAELLEAAALFVRYQATKDGERFDQTETDCFRMRYDEAIARLTKRLETAEESARDRDRAAVYYHDRLRDMDSIVQLFLRHYEKHQSQRKDGSAL